jgi:hypothetical protein
MRVQRSTSVHRRTSGNQRTCMRSAVKIVVRTKYSRVYLPDHKFTKPDLVLYRYYSPGTQYF